MHPYLSGPDTDVNISHNMGMASDANQNVCIFVVKPILQLNDLGPHSLVP